MSIRYKKVILSFDYELFFGDESGTVQKTLINPTNAILDAMDSVNAKGNFFVDWQMLKYLQVVGTERTISDYELIVNQLHDMIRRGHRIELHIHPHWVDAKYRGDGTWDFSDFRHYSLHSFSEEEIVELFVEGTNLLTDIAREVDPEYKIVAFRAGGWAIQPFLKLKEAFKKSGIVIDSSVACGMHATHKYSFYDFRNAPVKPFYRFDDDVCEEIEDGDFLEVPISTCRRMFINRVLNFLMRKTSTRFNNLTDGTHYRAKDVDWETKQVSQKKIKKRLGMMMLWDNPINLPINIYRHSSSLVCIIDHPKDFTGVTSDCLKWIGRTCKIVTYSDLCNNI